MLAYGRSEHECLPNLEQDMLIGDSSEHISLPRSKQDLLTNGSLEHECYSAKRKICSLMAILSMYATQIQRKIC